jgi:DNA polymerase-3 subunit alpha
LARLIPAIPGKAMSIDKALDEVPDLRTAYEDPDRPYVARLLDTARQLEGISRHASTHAAGVLVADKPLVEYTPLHRPTKGGEADGLGVVSQWPMEIVESIGLLKVDFLGLRTLTIMRKAAELIERYHGIRYDLGSIPYRHRPDNPEYNEALDRAFRLLSEGDTGGVFQVEGGGMRRVLTESRRALSTSSRPSRCSGPARLNTSPPTSAGCTARKRSATITLPWNRSWTRRSASSSTRSRSCRSPPTCSATAWLTRT